MTSRSQKRVLQIGPEPGSPGGMASVIEELTNLPLNGYELLSLPSWGNRKGVLSLQTAATAGIQMLRSRNAWSLAHIHLSEFGSFVREGGLVLLSHFLKKPVVVSLHGARFAEQVKRHPRITRFVLSRASHVLCLGPHQQQIVKTIVPGAQTSLIANPVGQVRAEEGEGHRAQSAVADSPNHESPRLLFVGEVGLRKGADILLDAWRTLSTEFPDGELRLIGPRTREPLDLPSPAVSCLGVLSRDEIRTEMRSATLVVLPSRAEVLPMVVLEALQQGARVVYSRVGEWTNFDQCEFVALVGTPEEEPTPSQVVEVLRQSLQRGPLTEASRQGALTWVTEFAGHATIAKRLSSVYNRAIETGMKR